MGSVKKKRKKKINHHRHRKFLKNSRAQRVSGRATLRSKKKKSKKRNRTSSL